jgi:hypothetical protein
MLQLSQKCFEERKKQLVQHVHDDLKNFLSHVAAKDLIAKKKIAAGTLKR